MGPIPRVSMGWGKWPHPFRPFAPLRPFRLHKGVYEEQYWITNRARCVYIVHKNVQCKITNRALYVHCAHRCARRAMYDYQLRAALPSSKPLHSTCDSNFANEIKTQFLDVQLGWTEMLKWIFNSTNETDNLQIQLFILCKFQNKM